MACVVGDGEAETGPLATAWHSNKFLNAATDGAVLPILHLNGYKIANPTLLARIPREELEQLMRGYGWEPLFVEGHEAEPMHQKMAATLDIAIEKIKSLQENARVNGDTARPRWPMIVLNSPKGWTGPEVVDGLQIEGTFRAHQVPLHPHAHPEHLKLLENWMRSYRPEELFDETGRLNADLAALAPEGAQRMGANPHANGGLLLHDLKMPDFRDYAEDVPSPGVRGIGDTHVAGRFLRDVAKLNQAQRNFRVFGPDETLSNGLEALFDVTERQWEGETVPNDEFLAPSGRVMEMLSEHQCEGWLEGYLLTGRHGLFNCYEAFIHIIDSMFNQHAKWLKVTSGLPWRRPIASLNYLLASHVWRQDHNGFTHQDPGFHRPRRQQKSRSRARLSAAGRQLLALGHGSLSAQSALCQRGDCRQASGSAVADDGRCGQALHAGYRHLAVGEQRSGSRARCGDGVLRRRANAGNARRRFDSARASARPQNPRRQRG